MNKRRIIQKQQQQRKNEVTQPVGGRLPWLIIGGVVLAALVVAGIYFLLNRPGTAAQPAAEYTYPEKIGTTLGEQDAPVYILVFSDFQCSYCKLFSETVQKQIVNEYVATGKARMEYRHMIVVDVFTGGEESTRAAHASECASEQRRFWPYHDLLYEKQSGEEAGVFSEENLQKYAAEIGLDAERFSTCLSSNRYEGKITVDDVLARQQNVNSTPAVFIAGKRIQDPNNWEAVKAAIDEALKSAAK